MIIATPISNLFANDQDALEIIKESDCLECRDRTIGSSLPNQYLLHLEPSIFHDWEEAEKKYILTAIKAKPELKCVSFHLSTAYPESKIEKHMFVPFGQKLTPEQLVENSRKNIKWLHSLLDPQTTIAVENNNYYPSGAYEHVTDGRFISSIVKDNKIGFVYDLAHALISAHNRKNDYFDYFSTLPMSDCVQLHISGYGIIDDDMACDSHDLPNDLVYEEVARIIKSNNKISYLTVEYYKDKSGLIKTIKKIRQLLGEV